MVALSPSLDGPAFAPPVGLTKAVSRRPARKASTDAPTTVGDRIGDFLRARHPSKTAENVAAETGCSVDQVEKWLERGSAPNAPAMCRLIAAYGPEFLCAAMHSPPDWLHMAVRAERSRALEAEIQQRQRELDRLRGVR